MMKRLALAGLLALVAVPTLAADTTSSGKKAAATSISLAQPDQAWARARENAAKAQACACPHGH